MALKVGELFGELDLKDGKFNTGLDNAKKKMGDAAKNIGKMAIGVTGALVGVGASAIAMGNKFASSADVIDKTSQRVGVSTDAWQELEYAMGQNGISAGDTEKALGRLNQRMGMAVDGNEKYADALEKLGVKTEDIKNGTITTDQAFMQSIDTLSKMENANARASLAQELFGTKLSRELAPALNAGADGVQELRDKAHELGNVMGGESVSAGVQYADAMDSITRSGKQVFYQIAGELMPSILAMVKWVEENLPSMQEKFREIMGHVKVAIGWAVDAFNVAKSMFEENSGAIDEILTDLKGIFLDIFEAVKEIVLAFVKIATMYWDRFGDDLIKIIKIVWSTVSKVVENAKNIVLGIIDTLIGLLTGDWSRMADGLKQIWNNLWDAIETVVKGAWNVLKIQFSALWSAFSEWFGNLKDDAVQWGKDVISGFLSGITSMAGSVWSKAKEIANGVKDTIASALRIQSPSKELEEIGEYTGAGFVKGMDKMAKKVKETAGMLANNAMPQIRTMNSAQPLTVDSGLGGSVTVNLYGSNHFSSDIDISDFANRLGTEIKTQMRVRGV